MIYVDTSVVLAQLLAEDRTPPVLARALDPFPSPLRTLDALHLASAEFLRQQGQSVRLATYDDRMADAARSLDIEIYPL